MKTIRVNLAQMDKWSVTSDNVRFYDAIMRERGEVVTLDPRPYTELLTDFGIFFTAPLAP